LFLLLGLAVAPAPAFAQAAEPSSPTRTEEVTVVGDHGRLRLFLDDTVLSPTLAPRLAFSAGLDQRSGSPVAWGGGPGGFGKRMAARAGLALAQSGVQHATAAAMGLDPRGDQSRCGCSHPLRRASYALTRTFFTRDARGRGVPNVPLVVGAAGGAVIARAWYPRQDGPGKDAAKLAALTVVAQAGANVFREFAPEMKRLLPRRHRQPKPAARSQAAAAATARADADPLLAAH
jgi:hypothetical protein